MCIYIYMCVCVYIHIFIYLFKVFDGSLPCMCFSACQSTPNYAPLENAA